MPSLFSIATPEARLDDDSDDEADDMDLDAIAAGPSGVGPGDVVASANDWMRGHGTFVDASEVRATVAGAVERVNRLVSVRPWRARYRPEVGDLVIGRINEVQPKRWKVDTSARQDAVLMLGSVNLPGGVQRRKLESDELQMRTFFQEGDLVVAEVQSILGDGATSLHTRSLKYGKLRNGLLVRVPSQLVVRQKSHFHSLACGADVIIGLNGWVWISKREVRAEAAEGMEGEAMYSDVNDDLPPTVLATLARVSLVVGLLGEFNVPVSDATISDAFDVSLEVAPGTSKKLGVELLLRPDIRERVVASLLSGR